MATKTWGASLLLVLLVAATAAGVSCGNTVDVSVLPSAQPAQPKAPSKTVVQVDSGRRSLAQEKIYVTLADVGQGRRSLALKQEPSEDLAWPGYIASFDNAPGTPAAEQPADAAVVHATELAAGTELPLESDFELTAVTTSR
ncbi:hypothetical protein FOA52_011408 [Chlamydomonas sp. UWO 241]|nr:hypothetical protein FOA52_011408 [Chlamydomonas sp. UWO 241]